MIQYSRSAPIENRSFSKFQTLGLRHGGFGLRVLLRLQASTEFPPKKHWMQIISGIYFLLVMGARVDAGTWPFLPSAIDNATRCLIKLDQFSVTCGLFFSLGHSTIVILVVSILRSSFCGDPKIYILLFCAIYRPSL